MERTTARAAALAVILPLRARSSIIFRASCFSHLVPGHQNAHGMAQKLPIVQFFMQPDGAVFVWVRCAVTGQRCAQQTHSRGQPSGRVDGVEACAVKNEPPTG